MAHKKSKDETLICFIKATQELITEEGMKALSARKISQRAGFHNSMIFFYFGDLDRLITLACIKYLKPYNDALAELSRYAPSVYKEFYIIWYIFCEHAFSQPEIYQHLFFGKHSKNLAEIFDEYYRLFPAEQTQFDTVVNRMYGSKNFAQRCLSILEPLVASPDTRVSEDNLRIVNKIIMNNFECFLNKICHKEEIDIQATIISFHEILHFVIDKN